jgi:hypothetical protein
VSEERSRQSRGTPLGRERAHALDKVQARASGRPAPSKRPADPIAIYCEIDSLPAELERAELSSAGAFVLSTQPPQVDSEVSIFLRIGEQRFEMTGHVVHSVSCEQAAKQGKKPGYALLFTNLPEGERKRISGTLQSVRASLRPRASPPPKAAAQTKASPPPTASQPSKSPAAASAQQSRSPARPAPQPAAPAFDPSELVLLQKLEQELAQVEEKTAWAVLGVSQGAEPERIKTAFFQASKRYHPHLFARYAHPEIKRIVTELFIAHKRAFTTMTKLNKKHA